MRPKPFAITAVCACIGRRLAAHDAVTGLVPAAGGHRGLRPTGGKSSGLSGWVRSASGSSPASCPAPHGPRASTRTLGSERPPWPACPAGTARRPGTEPPAAPVRDTALCSGSVPRSTGGDRPSPRVLRSSITIDRQNEMRVGFAFHRRNAMRSIEFYLCCLMSTSYFLPKAICTSWLHKHKVLGFSREPSHIRPASTVWCGGGLRFGRSVTKIGVWRAPKALTVIGLFAE
jgi:hypothetical protein